MRVVTFFALYELFLNRKKKSYPPHSVNREAQNQPSFLTFPVSRFTSTNQ